MLQDYKKEVSSSLTHYRDLKRETPRRRSPSPLRGTTPMRSANDSLAFPATASKTPYQSYGY